MPRVALSSANIATPVTDPADALLIYNTETAGVGNNAVSPGFYYWNSASGRWAPVSRTAAAETVGFGSWGGCGRSITEYNPVSDFSGEASDHFGWSVAISGNYAMICIPNDNYGVAGVRGTVAVYQFNGTNWTFLQTLTDPTASSGDGFGFSVAMNGTYAVIGSPFDRVGANSNQGSVSIFRFNGSSWVFMQKVTDATGATTDQFGWSVALSGTTLIAGAPYDDGTGGIDQGSASIYRYNGATWVLGQKLVDASGAADDSYGESVGIYVNYAIVGSPEDDITVTNQGSAIIYSYNGTTWNFFQRLTNSAFAANENFGKAVAIHSDFVAVGIPSADVGGTDRGMCRLYQFIAATWTPVRAFSDPGGVNVDHFGDHLFLTDQYLSIGVPPRTVDGVYFRGAAFIYMRIGQGWQKHEIVTDPGGEQDDAFGYSTAIDPITKRFVIGAYGYNTFTGKAIFGKVN